ncbi:cytochrome P450 6B6-like [Choristoneura fumiferana]|uniref:cytochrome P450 6B6-like n=1 Tax=Choristoneura fumiferana TaxID=7141 RepID=UPI003D154EB8
MFNYLAIFFALLTISYLYATRKSKYWKKKGVKYEEPIPFFGSNMPNILVKQSIPQIAEKMYWKYPEEKVVGHFYFCDPALLIRDPDLITPILSTHFKSFYTRGYLDGQEKYKLEILMKNLFCVEGPLWKLLKKSMSPLFTTSKLKAIFPIIETRAERLRERLATASADARPVDATDLTARYNIDFICAYGLGLDTDSQKNECSAIRRLSLKIFDVGFNEICVSLLKHFFPVTFKNFKYLEKVEKEFLDLFNNILRERKSESLERHDFLDLMLKLKARGKIEGDWKSPDGTLKQICLEVDDEILAAQVFMFFTAGFDTSSISTSYTLHEIAYNPEEQKKIQEDIDRVLAKHNNKLSYDAVKEMQYLEWAFMEGLRIFPPVGFFLRMCEQKCFLDDANLTVDEGTRIVIPIRGLHHDPKYWDNPEEFRPERFSPKINEPKHKSAYLPFGIGPRSCIGERLAMMQSMAALATILSHFTITPAPASVRRPIVNPKNNLVQGVIGGLPLIFTPRKL